MSVVSDGGLDSCVSWNMQHGSILHGKWCHIYCTDMMKSWLVIMFCSLWPWTALYISQVKT